MSHEEAGIMSVGSEARESCAEMRCAAAPTVLRSERRYNGDLSADGRMRRATRDSVGKPRPATPAAVRSA